MSPPSFGPVADHDDVAGGDLVTEGFVRPECLEQARAASATRGVEIGLCRPGEIDQRDRLAEPISEGVGVRLWEGSAALAVCALGPRIAERDVREALGGLACRLRPGFRKSAAS